MDKIRIVGGKKLQGTVQVGGAKNAALPNLIACLLTDQPLVLSSVPKLNDIFTTLKLLKSLGVDTQAQLDKNQVQVCAKKITDTQAPYDLVRTMRASVVVLGPLLAREGRAKVSLPGGCAIGARPINFHLHGLEKLGAKITLEGGYVIAEAKKLKGSHIRFEFPSVGATENILMAATLAEGQTVLENCAQEPEIVDLAVLLKKMGAKIEGEGTDRIEIQGVQSLNGCSHQIMGDRIEAATYLIAGLMTHGEVTVRGIDPAALTSVLDHLAMTGAKLSLGKEQISLSASDRARATDIVTQPFPGFPTDVQAQWMAAMTTADGTSLITETVFENRFMHVPELTRLGAEIVIKGKEAQVRGVAELTGAPLMATDLRASASLVLAGLVAKGETWIHRVYHLDRGYESMETRLQALGAQVERVK